MRSLPSIALVALFAGCVSNQPVIPKVEAPPPHVVESRNERLGRPGIVNDQASRAWLDREIERKRDAGPVKPPPPVVVDYEREDRTRYVSYDDYGYYRYPGYGYYRGGPGYRYYDPYRQFRLSLFGAGLGAIIGHQSGNRDEGALIGAGLGILLGR